MTPKIFAFLVEPSSYTLDITEKIYKKLQIEHIFFNSKPIIAKSHNGENKKSLSDMKLGKKLILLRQVWKSYDFFIFNGYNTKEFLLFFMLSWLYKGKKFIALDSDTQYKTVTGPKRVIKSIYLQTIFRQPFVLGFAGGSKTHKDLFRKYGMEEERIFLMPMMVNNEKFEYSKKKRKRSPFTFLYVGRIIPHKNVEMLIKSFIEAFGGSEDVELKIVGTGESFEWLHKKYSVNRNISFEGPKFGQDLVDAYHASNVLVIPSLYEPWGLVVNEALSAGLPVLASNRVGAVYDLIENRDTGFIFDPEKPEELKMLMQKMFEDEDLYEKHSSNAAKLMKEYWNYGLYRKNLEEAVKYVERQISGEKK